MDPPFFVFKAIRFFIDNPTNGECCQQVPTMWLLGRMKNICLESLKLVGYQIVDPVGCIITMSFLGTRFHCNTASVLFEFGYCTKY